LLEASQAINPYVVHDHASSARTNRMSLLTTAVYLRPDIEFHESLNKLGMNCRLVCHISDLNLGRSFERWGPVTFLSDAATNAPFGASATARCIQATTWKQT